ncbi:Histone deacetylase complex subunit SAP18 [Trifolium repens]|nr:Histone deacetylase complex subunit SAP18 [Trifolium repens]
MSGEGSSRRPRRRPRDDSPPSVHCVCNSRYRNHIGTHHTGDMFNPRRNKPRDEIHVHTWMDATLREITREVKDMVHRTASRKNAKFSFAIVSRNRNSNYEVRKVGEVLCYESSETETETEVLQDNLTLRDLGFCKVKS